MIDLQRILEDTGALLEGHFLLTSGRHSDRYIEKFRLLEQPEALDAAARAMVQAVQPREVEVVLGAAVGGILLAGAVARVLNRRIMFAERVDGALTLRRGFTLERGQLVYIVEDIVTTGGSVVELMELVQAAGAQVRGVALLVDRSEGRIDFGVPTKVLLRLPIRSWEPGQCPLCRQGLSLTERGRTGKN